MDKLLCIHVQTEELPSVATFVVELHSKVDERLDVPRRETRVCGRCVCTVLAALLAVDGEPVV